MLTQGPGRLSALAGKLAVIATLLVVYVLVCAAGAAATSAALGLADGAALQWPESIDIAKALVASSAAGHRLTGADPFTRQDGHEARSVWRNRLRRLSGGR